MTMKRDRSVTTFFDRPEGEMYIRFRRPYSVRVSSALSCANAIRKAWGLKRLHAMPNGRWAENFDSPLERALDHRIKISDEGIEGDKQDVLTLAELTCMSIDHRVLMVCGDYRPALIDQGNGRTYLDGYPPEMGSLIEHLKKIWDQEYDVPDDDSDLPVWAENVRRSEKRK